MFGHGYQPGGPRGHRKHGRRAMWATRLPAPTHPLPSPPQAPMPSWPRCCAEAARPLPTRAAPPATPCAVTTISRPTPSPAPRRPQAFGSHAQSDERPQQKRFGLVAALLHLARGREREEQLFLRGTPAPAARGHRACARHRRPRGPPRAPARSARRGAKLLPLPECWPQWPVGWNDFL